MLNFPRCLEEFLVSNNGTGNLLLTLGQDFVSNIVEQLMSKTELLANANLVEPCNTCWVLKDSCHTQTLGSAKP